MRHSSNSELPCFKMLKELLGVTWHANFTLEITGNEFVPQPKVCAS